jgi:sec-independent protein translocase protein TatA
MIYPLANLFGIESWMVILVVGLLLFGKRMPEVGRSLGRGIVEFKKGLQGLEDDIETAARPNSNTIANRQLPAANAGYKFDPYTGKPLQAEPPAAPQMRFDPYTGQPLTDQTVGADQGRTV